MRFASSSAAVGGLLCHLGAATAQVVPSSLESRQEILRQPSDGSLKGLIETGFGQHVLGAEAPGFAVRAALDGANDAPCPTQYTVPNTSLPGRVSCPCFAISEEAGVVFEAPANHYPIQIVKVGIGWGSQQGGSPNSLEDAIIIYSGGLPRPGGPLSQPLAVISSPQMVDGAISVFDLPQVPDPIIVQSGKFTVTLKFANANVPPPTGLPSVVHDGAGCTPGKNVLRIAAPFLPFGWYDACSLGVSGNWVFQVVYQRVLCPCPGDYNNDRVVNFFDLNQVLAGYGSIYSFSDLVAVLGNFSTSC